MAENDQKDKTVEKVTGEVENTDKKENNEDRYEKLCFICHINPTFFLILSKIKSF